MNKPLSKALWRINVKRKLVCKIEFGIEKLEGEIFKKWLQHRTLTMMDNASDSDRHTGQTSEEHKITA